MIGYIYMISSNNKNYIGSTVKLVKYRFSFHKSAYKRYKRGVGDYCSVFDVFDEGETTLTILKTYQCNNELELRKYENQCVLLLDCVNKNMPSRTLKQYYIDNKISFKLRYQMNKIRLIQYQKEYYNKKKMLNTNI